MSKDRKTLVTGVIGADAHNVGIRILSMALEKAGFRVHALGALTPAEDFIRAAVETDADVIMVSSLYGHGHLDCRGFRERCIEAGIGDIRLYIGGNLVIGKHDWPAVHQTFLDMGFNRAYPPTTRPAEVITDLKRDLGLSEE